MAPASNPVDSSYQRRPAAAVTSTSPSPAMAAHNRAAISLSPSTTDAAAASQ